MAQNDTQQTSGDNRDLDALIKVYEMQLVMTQDTIDKLKELRDCHEELELYRRREAERLLRQNPELKGEE